MPISRISEPRLNELLRALTAKYSLDDEDIVHCYLVKDAANYSDRLEVQRAGTPASYRCGDDTCFTAHIVEEG